MNNFLSLIMYISFFSLACFFLHISEKLEDDKNIACKIFSFFSFIIPFVISGFRYAVGTDYFNYISGYEFAYNQTFMEFFQSKDLQIGFFLIRKVAAIFDKCQIMFLISSFITLFFSYKAIYEHRNKVPIWFSLCIYIFIFFPTSFNLVRQHIALSIILYSYKYIFEKNLRKFLMLCLLASCFHLTAVIVTPFYFVYNNDNRKRRLSEFTKNILKMGIIILVVIFILNAKYFISEFAQYDIFAKFAHYANEDSRGFNREFFLKIIILMLIVPFRKKLVKYDSRNKLYIYFLFIDLCITFIGFYNPFIKRIGLYFGITQIFLLPCMYKIINNKLLKILVVMCGCLYAIAFFILSFYVFGQSDIVPYNINI